MDKERLYKLEKQSLNFIEEVFKASKVPLYAGNSGGKDSAVLDFLLQKSGITYISEYGNTTIDPPGTLSHLRKYYPHTKIIQPKESFLKLVETHGLPTNQKRFCCQRLKEYIGIGKDTFLGTRSAESIARRGREYISCDTRSWMKGARHIYPIYDWKDQDVWDFIKLYKLPLAPIYSKGFTRLGCIGCPLAGKNIREYQFAKFPRYFNAIQKAITKGMKNNPQWLLSIITKGDGAEAMRWWMSGVSITEYYRNQYVITMIGREGRAIKWDIHPRTDSFGF